MNELGCERVVKKVCSNCMRGCVLKSYHTMSSSGIRRCHQLTHPVKPLNRPDLEQLVTGERAEPGVIEHFLTVVVSLPQLFPHVA